MRDQVGWDAHADFMNGLVDRRVVVMGGPLGAGERILLVVDAESEERVPAELDGDPWSVDGLLAVEALDEWDVLMNALGGG